MLKYVCSVTHCVEIPAEISNYDIFHFTDDIFIGHRNHYVAMDALGGVYYVDSPNKFMDWCGSSVNIGGQSVTFKLISGTTFMLCGLHSDISGREFTMPCVVDNFGIDILYHTDDCIVIRCSNMMVWIGVTIEQDGPYILSV